MTKTILITGSTDGIGKLTAQTLVSRGHRVILHGRNRSKLEATSAEIGGDTESYVADLSQLSDVETLAASILEKHEHLDVLINNAGVLKTANARTPSGLDLRFVVNTFAPYVLTRRLLPGLGDTGRVVNLSSAAQAPVNLPAMRGEVALGDMEAYAQSKLAITLWSRELAKELEGGPVVVAVNPGSLLASKMVKEGFGVAGNDLSIGADILCSAALDASFADASGKYYDNDAERFAEPHVAALNPKHVEEVMRTMREVIESIS